MTHCSLFQRRKAALEQMVEQERIRTEEKRRASEQKRLMKMQQEIELKEGLVLVDRVLYAAANPPHHQLVAAWKKTAELQSNYSRSRPIKKLNCSRLARKRLKQTKRPDKPPRSKLTRTVLHASRSGAMSITSTHN